MAFINNIRMYNCTVLETLIIENIYNSRFTKYVHLKNLITCTNQSEFNLLFYTNK